MSASRFALPALAAALVLPLAAQAHTTYGGTARVFGTFDSAGGSATISTQTISSNFGWADGTDADWGDAHRLRAFKFVLTDTLDVTISAQRNGDSALLPAFSLYSGLFHEAPDRADFDTALVTT